MKVAWDASPTSYLPWDRTREQVSSHVPERLAPRTAERIDQVALALGKPDGLVAKPESGSRKSGCQGHHPSGLIRPMGRVNGDLVELS